MSLLKINGLNKAYPNGTRALVDVDLELSKGMFGLLGPNGAGKSSLMRTLATLQEADSGTAFLGDIDILNDPQSVRKVLGYLPQEFGVYPRITAAQLLDHIATLNLYEARNKKVSGFSGGMKQRVGIAQALIGNPQLIIVDEPTAGLDPGERNRFHNLLAEVGEEVIVILSTHIVDDVRELCTDMAIMNLGQIVYKGTPADALTSLEGKVWRKTIDRSEKAAYAAQHTIISDKMVGGQPQIHVLSDQQPGDGFVEVAPNLEDVFFTTIHATVA